ncbi:MCE family protein [Pseudooceanicola sp. CBS1P-1]|uniref:MCE family protein n=1 Tax=Pseudooceanicola albus TaxID=2692189 RepID=A0A6L7G871_9RHOB|nr:MULTISPECIES: MlaD family protein [Pseudooceanicola]MBT9384173.1 MCE family protein [Pseudooceanicola endophyticus]MXN19728.1 MCE family protein [Pseudooceanicola albus]
MSDTPPDVHVTTTRRSLYERISLVWVVPILALIIALSVAWHNYAQRGPLIEIDFDSAEGVKAGETELHYRDVAVGVVEKLGFSADLNKVEVWVRLNKDVADYVDDSSNFWVVRPEVSARGVTGLGTVLSGVYIQGLWDSKPEGLKTKFEGLSQAPLNSDGKPGLKIRLRAAPGSGLTGDTVIEYRGIEVGRVGKAEISKDGSTVEAPAFIFAPQDKLITSATRFWDTSGFSFTLGPNGAALDISSVATLLQGGVSFETTASGGQEVLPDSTFTVYPDKDSAAASTFGDDEGPTLTLTAYFRENVAGLSVDAPVTLGGLQIGKVDAIGAIVDKDRFGDSDMHMVATLEIRPSKMGLKDKTPEGALAYLSQQVKDEGLRARLVTASILTGGLKVELTSNTDADPGTLDESAQPNPVIPTAPGQISDVAANAQGILDRVSALPIEQLMSSAINTLNNISALVGSDDTRAVPGEIRGLLDDTRKFVGSDGVQQLPQQLSSVADNINGVLTQVQHEEMVKKVTDAIQGVTDAAQAFSGAVTGVPALIQRLDSIAANAANVPLDQLADSLDGLMQTVDSFLQQSGTKELPAHLSQALDQLRDTLKELREGGAVDNLNDTLASANDAAKNVTKVSQDLPALIANAQAVLAQAATTLRGYDARDGVGRDVTDTLRQVQRAADAISALAREVQRNPNSLLFGR